MERWQCGLCTYVYGDGNESIKWSDLPEGWVCPVCGSPKSAFSLLAEGPHDETGGKDIQADVQMSFLQCGLCSHVYDESLEGSSWENLSQDWVCPVCGSGKSAFSSMGAPPPAAKIGDAAPAELGDEYLLEWRRSSDDVETHMADIHQLAISGHSIIEPMRTRVPTFSWDEILVRGAQLAKLPLNKSQPVNVQTVIGPNASVPLVLESPIFVTHMSFGALSREAKLALAKGSSEAQTAMCSGEGGILPECLGAAYKYIFEYVPNKYSLTDDYLSRVDAVEIKIGQSAKPGMGGHLPGHKVTREIAEIRGFHEGHDIISPSHFPDIRSGDDLRTTIGELRSRTGGKPIGVKLAAGHLKDDIEIALAAGADFITIDGRAGGTGAALKVVKGATSVPTVFALGRAREVLDASGAEGISLIVTGGLRVSSDFAKALALGANAIAVGTAAMMAVGCQQYRICDTGKCPVGIATQDPALRARLDVEKSALRVANFFRACTEEIREFARLTGNSNVHDLSPHDLCTVNSEISSYIGIEHV